MGKGLTTIGNAAFYNCESLESITFPASLREIGDSAFSGCTTMTDLVINDGLTTIGKQAFYGSDAIVNVTLPASIEKIGLYAFSTQLRGYELVHEIETGEVNEDGEPIIEIETEHIDVTFNTVEGSYAADYIANPPTSEEAPEDAE
jgi:hypothetical protein